ncbi:hypothetical protein B0H21DRAFT_472545 [Amylocystis lapponica]|nr:hypothetical protein B0H21DRAFT_472545 [Amylocystis lapponica]
MIDSDIASLRSHPICFRAMRLPGPLRSSTSHARGLRSALSCQRRAGWRSPAALAQSAPCDHPLWSSLRACRASGVWICTRPNRRNPPTRRPQLHAAPVAQVAIRSVANMLRGRLVQCRHLLRECVRGFACSPVSPAPGAVARRPAEGGRDLVQNGYARARRLGVDPHLSARPSPTEWRPVGDPATRARPDARILGTRAVSVCSWPRTRTRSAPCDASGVTASSVFTTYLGTSHVILHIRVTMDTRCSKGSGAAARHIREKILDSRRTDARVAGLS